MILPRNIFLGQEEDVFKLNFWFSHIHVSCKCRIQTGQVSVRAGPLMNGRMNSSRWTWRPRTLSFRMAMIEDLPEYGERVKGAVWRKKVEKVRLSQGSDFWSAGVRSASIICTRWEDGRCTLIVSHSPAHDRGAEKESRLQNHKHKYMVSANPQLL